jgi:signal recognition particle subunit SRP54
MHRQMADMMKLMGKQRGGLMQRMMGFPGGGAAPSPAELDKMQADLARLDPKVLEKLPKDLKGSLPRGLPGLSGGGLPKLPGVPGLGGAGLPRLPGLPGAPGKKK